MKSRKPHDPRYDLDDSRKVFIYKNLHKDCWSIKQDGLVKAHVDGISLYNCSFRVNRLGRLRVLRQKRKNVHAGATGWIDSRETFDWNDNNPKGEEVTYNPYKHKSFVYKQDKRPCFWSRAVKLEKNKVLAVPCVEDANFTSVRG
jgi:hypothetical protein